MLGFGWSQWIKRTRLVFKNVVGKQTTRINWSKVISSNLLAFSKNINFTCSASTMSHNWASRGTISPIIWYHMAVFINCGSTPRLCVSHISTIFIDLKYSKKNIGLKLIKYKQSQIILRSNVLRHQFYLRNVIIQVLSGNGVLNRLVSYIKCMKLTCWVPQAGLNLYYYHR